MGLIKAALTATSQVVGDQFKELITVGNADSSILVQRGTVNHGPGNLNYTEGVITNGSTIIVPVGYAMMMVENGAIKEFTAEEGTYTWDSTAQPSVFEGGFFKGIGDSIKQIGNRITYGGQAANDQRVYYINIKNITGNKFGSQQPVTISDPRYGSVEVTYNGEYSFKVVDPAVLVAQLLGSNPKDVVTVEEVVGGQLKTQFSSNVSTCISNLMIQNNISFNAIQGYKNDVVAVMNSLLDESWTKQYGLTILDVALNVNASEESKEIIRNLDKQIAMGNAYAANPNGMMAAATGTAMQTAAGNTNGAMMGFMGMNMAQNTGSTVMGAAQQMAATPAPNGSTPAPGSVTINQTAVPVPEAPVAPVEAAPVETPAETTDTPAE